MSFELWVFVMASVSIHIIMKLCVLSDSAFDRFNKDENGESLHGDWQAVYMENSPSGLFRRGAVLCHCPWSRQNGAFV